MVEKLEPKGGEPENPEGFRGNYGADSRQDKYREDSYRNGRPAYNGEERKESRFDHARRSRSPRSHSRGRSPLYRGLHSRSGSKSPPYSPRAARRKSGSQSREGERREKRAYSPETFQQIYVTGYSHNCSEKELADHFGQIGSIKEVLMKRGFSFIEYKFPEHAAAAVKHFDGQTFQSKTLRVERSSKQLS